MNQGLAQLQSILASGPPGEADLALLNLLGETAAVKARKMIIEAGYPEAAARLLP
jgi:hypothetical protein